MSYVFPEFTIDFIKKHYFLVQAWKKTVPFIRYHNWYADTLKLDMLSAELPDFINYLSQQLSSWQNDPIKMVPAPKSQKWEVHKGIWRPKTNEHPGSKLRPIADVSPKDQIIATAIMLCLADKVENLQGSTKSDTKTELGRKKVISYGNRLYCSEEKEKLIHHWGSAKLYRSYFQDYETFVNRPEIVASGYPMKENVVVVHADLDKFYDRITPLLFHSQVIKIIGENADQDFLKLIDTVFDWEWDKASYNKQAVSEYIKNSGLQNYQRVVLPQGLVSAGFFANLVLISFDEYLMSQFGLELSPGIKVLDICRYVDDLRIVLDVQQKDYTSTQIKEFIEKWLQLALDKYASGLLISDKKTKVSYYQGDNNPIVYQSKKIARIQSAISGGFDVQGGQRILDAIQGIINAQNRFVDEGTENNNFSLSPIPDVRDETVSRFAANRYRSTYRSLRPLMRDAEEPCEKCVKKSHVKGKYETPDVITKTELDNDAKIFAFSLIDNWIADPSNVRLLRVGLDLWPDSDLLSQVLDILKHYVQDGRGNKAQKRVAWYCLSQIFRAGATETGFIGIEDALPAEINIDKYRETLKDEAIRVLNLASIIPWYLKQQALLYLTVYSPFSVPKFEHSNNQNTVHYMRVILFLRNELPSITGNDFAKYATLVRRSYLSEKQANDLILPQLTPTRLEKIFNLDAAFAYELSNSLKGRFGLTKRLKIDLCISNTEPSNGWSLLTQEVFSSSLDWCNEIVLLQFARLFLEKYSAIETSFLNTAIPPNAILIKWKDKNKQIIDGVDIQLKTEYRNSLFYQPPAWCEGDDCWRFQLGYLLRFILTKQYDYTRNVRPVSWKENCSIYRIPESHWYLRDHGMYSGFSAFGADWLPISDWIESFLFGLLHWPGCKSNGFYEWIKKGISTTIVEVQQRMEDLILMYGKASSAMMLPISAPSFNSFYGSKRPFRACIVQKIIPDDACFEANPNDITFSDPRIRRCHRNHLSATLAALEKMLELRETHENMDGRLDLVVFPELSLHPDDIVTHIVPFVRKHRTIVLAGINYTEIAISHKCINSALWIIPSYSLSYGLQILIRRQGKAHLSLDESKFLRDNHHNVEGFRPCQWIINYEWEVGKLPLRLTGSICYDATDIKLTSDLRTLSDIFIIPSLNKDVKTYDQMALSLHYIMYQMIIVANNGTYGGSNAFAPFKDEFKKEIFHLHGQPQATFGFLELSEKKISTFINRWISTADYWKPPPCR